MRGVAAVNARTQGAAEALFAGKSACGLLGFDSTHNRVRALPDAGGPYKGRLLRYRRTAAAMAAPA